MSQSIILVTVDCLRPDHIHCYGYERETTPNIDQLAATGQQFETVYSNGPSTRFAFKTIHGGVYPQRVPGIGFAETAGTTLAEHLSAHGYVTGGFADNPFVSRHYNFHRGFDTFYDVNDWEFAESQSKTYGALHRLAGKLHAHLPDGQIHDTLKQAYIRLTQTVEARGVQVETPDERVVETTLDWIESVDDDRPFFAWLHLMGVHAPYQYRPEIREELGIETEHVKYPADEVEAGSEPPQRVVDSYDTNLRNTDEAIGTLLSRVPEDALLVLTADHGEEMGRHLPHHWGSPFEGMARVPLLVRNAPRNVPTAQPTSHVNLTATLGRIGTPAREGLPDVWDGVPFWDQQEGAPIFISFRSEEGLWGGIRDDNWKYIVQSDEMGAPPTRERLFDVAADPEETTDRSADNQAVLRSLRESWNEHVEALREERFEAEHNPWDADDMLDYPGTVDDETVLQRLEHLGYK